MKSWSRDYTRTDKQKVSKRVRFTESRKRKGEDSTSQDPTKRSKPWLKNVQSDDDVKRIPSVIVANVCDSDKWQEWFPQQ